MDKPVCYLHGDVYWSENAIKKIIDLEVQDTMFICIPDRQDGKIQYNIKGREPLGYKVQNNEIFNNAVNELKQMIDDGKFKKDPISWHLYRKINNIEMDYNGFGNDIFKTQGDYITIDDYTTDIDMPRDIPKIEQLLKLMKGGNYMVIVEVIETFHLGRFNELKNIKRKSVEENGTLFVGDIFECTQDFANYLMNEENSIYPTDKNGYNNPGNRAFVKHIGNIVDEEPKVEKVEEIEEKPVKKTTRKTTRKSVAKKK